MDPMNDLYPIAESFNEGMLPVSDLHTLHYSEAGNPDGIPVIFIHGGPGAGTSPRNRRFFDPEAYRIILLDQRGSGKSTPMAELRDNTTWHLVEDIEKLRRHLQIERWMVFGGSWGSTLSLTYAIEHPERVLGLILRGIFLCSPREIQWFYQEGASRIFPDEWEKYVAHIPENERHDMVAAYYRRLTDPNPDVQIAAAKSWSIWEALTSNLYPDYDEAAAYEENAERALKFARIEAHYFINHGFFPEPDYHLKRIDRIRHIPTHIVQGRYDIVCPMETAWALHRAFPEAKFQISADSGHSAMEKGNRAALKEATDHFKTLLKGVH
jgi:proline iminopeptidase